MNQKSTVLASLQAAERQRDELAADNARLRTEYGEVEADLRKVQTELDEEWRRANFAESKIDALAAERDELEKVLATRNEFAAQMRTERDALANNYAKLKGVVDTYLAADPMTKGEAFRDLDATVRFLAGHEADRGWPACYRRVESERDLARDNMRILARESSEQKMEIARMRKVLGGLVDAIGKCGGVVPLYTTYYCNALSAARELTNEVRDE